MKNKMKRIGMIALVLVSTILCAVGKAQEPKSTNPMILHPERYIKVTDWSLYAPMPSAVAIIHHVTIENTSDIAYKDIKVRVHYYSISTSQEGTLISQETGVLPITLPHHSKKTYLEGG